MRLATNDCVLRLSSQLGGTPVGYIGPQLRAVFLGLVLAALLLGAASSAWAAGWWYLVVPPRSEYDEHAQFLSAYKVLESKPLSEWKLGGIFDSILHCVARRDSLALTEHKLYTEVLGVYLKEESAPTDPELLRYDRYTAEVHNANYSAYSASRCVSSQDFKFGPPR